jgi:glycosyltransferase involved in cell wall biosynthesis
MISIVILTYNEAVNIERCLASVVWADDVLVIDSGSSDRTCELARKHGARVMHRPFDDFAQQRNFALDNGTLKYEWVLHLDADEEVTPELHSEMLKLALSGMGKPGYLVPSRLMLLGQWLKHSGMYPSYQVRFGSRDLLRFHMVGHGQREILDPNEVGTIEGALIHHNFSKGISEWLSKHARYAHDEAMLAVSEPSVVFRWRDLLQNNDSTMRRRSLKQLGNLIPMRPLARFVYVYFFRKGFLDGKAGLRYALLMAVYQWMIDLNLIELQRQTKAKDIE